MQPLQSSLSKGLFQVAYVVRDIQEAQRFFSQTLGGPRFFVIENITFREYTYRGQPVEARQHTAFGYAGTMQIELIQPISGENTASELLRQQGMGVHHLGIQVHAGGERYCGSGHTLRHVRCTSRHWQLYRAGLSGRSQPGTVRAYTPIAVPSSGSKWECSPTAALEEYTV